LFALPRPQDKTEILGAWMGLLSLNEKKFKSLKLENYVADQENFFTGGTHHKRSFVGGSMAHPNKSKMAAAAIFNFGNISITPDWIKISALNFMTKALKHQKLKCLLIISIKHMR